MKEIKLRKPPEMIKKRANIRILTYVSDHIATLSIPLGDAVNAGLIHKFKIKKPKIDKDWNK